jgi:hypothetical protein
VRTSCVVAKELNNYVSTSVEENPSLETVEKSELKITKELNVKHYYYYYYYYYYSVFCFCVFVLFLCCICVVVLAL